MNMLQDLEESINLEKLKNLNADEVKNAFFANYVASLILLKLQDLAGLKLINDHRHASLSKFSQTMSDLNFWGRALFHSKDADVKHRMNQDSAQELADQSKKVNSTRIQKIMKVPLSSPESTNWHEVIASLLLLKYTFKYRSSYLDSIIRRLYNWDSLNPAAKQKAINDAFMFLLQGDPDSKLLPRMRDQSNSALINRESAKKVVKVKRLKEDGDGGGGDGGAVSTGNIASNAIVSPGGGSSDFELQSRDLGGLYRLKTLAPNQVTKKSKFNIRDGKLIVKKVRKFAPKKFKAPDFLKPSKEKMKEIDDAK